MVISINFMIRLINTKLKQPKKNLKPQMKIRIRSLLKYDNFHKFDTFS